MRIMVKASELQPGDVFYAGPTLRVLVARVSEPYRSYGRTMVKINGTSVDDGHLAEVDALPDTEITVECVDGHRPDDMPESGDRCKDCGRRITWVGPSHLDWETAAE